MTQYQYETAGGLSGRLIDRFLFRPLLGWATAWSFDALRLWIEQNRHPKVSVRFGFVYVLTCLIFSLYWFFEGFYDCFADSEIVRGALETGVGVLWLFPMRRRAADSRRAVSLLLCNGNVIFRRRIRDPVRNTYDSWFDS